MFELDNSLSIDNCKSVCLLEKNKFMWKGHVISDVNRLLTKPEIWMFSKVDFKTRLLISLTNASLIHLVNVQNLLRVLLFSYHFRFS